MPMHDSMKVYHSLNVAKWKALNFLFSLSIHKSIRENSLHLAHSRNVIFLECGELQYIIMLILKGHSCVSYCTKQDLVPNDDGLLYIPRTRLKKNKLSPAPEIIFVKNHSRYKIDHPFILYI